MPTHQLSVTDERDFDDPVVTVARTWDGPVYLVAQCGQNIVAVNKPVRVFLVTAGEESPTIERDEVSQ